MSRPLSCKTWRFLAVLSISLVSACAARTAHAYEYPSVEHGFKPERAFQIGDVDHIRLFNGGLELAVPIGPGYPVGGNFSYGLSLHYSSQLWDYWSNELQGVARTQAWPVRYSNAGFGWRLSLGEYVPFGTTGPGVCHDCYISPDGARHSFAFGSPTKDGAYLRRRAIPGGWEVDFPNGDIHTFDASGQLTHMRDRFGNFAHVVYSSLYWRITDSLGRQQTVYLRSAPHYGQVVDRVVLTAFGGSQATYTFRYSEETVPRSCLDDDPATSDSLLLPLLTEVELPDGSSYSMPVADYELESPTSNCGGPSFLAPFEGLLEAMTLPNGGRIEWGWTPYEFPVPIEGEGSEDPPWLAKTAGVRQRTLRTADGSVHGTWTYTQVLPGGQNAEESVTQVRSPLGDRTDHYFRVGDDPEAKYGLPFSPLESAPGRPELFRSTKGYDCNSSGTNCQLQRTTYLDYQIEVAGTGLELNPRVRASYTRFHDDNNRWTAVDRSNWDGLGHYRVETTSGNFDAANTRTTFTNYNPGGTPAPGQAWILGTFDSRQVTEGGETTREELCFQGSTGYLQRLRVLTSGTGRGSNDLISVFTRDSSGNTIRERRYGSDLGSAGLGEICSTGLGTQQSRMDHTYQHGVRATSRYRRVNGSDLGFLSLDRTIDQSTGLVASIRDTALVQTTFSYDAFGRVTQEIPAEDSKATYLYTRARGQSKANVLVRRIANGGTAVRSEQRLTFDHFGRLHVEERKMPSGAWSKRTTFYNALGWRTDLSEWELSGTSHTGFTKFRDFDPFGRARRIEPRDGAAHDVDFIFFGIREVKRTARIATGAQGAESAVTTTERYDRQGRLHQVVEPSGAGGANVTTTYSYDEGGRLSFVDSGASQTRSFTYDNRGLLTRECHPEKGAAGNGCVTYGNYNVWGQPGRTTDGPNDLRLLYDPAGRLTDIEEWGGARHPLKHWTFGTGIGAADRSRGKVKVAERYNYVVLGTTPYTDLVRETYVYGNHSGRVYQRTIENFINPQPGSSPSDTFLQFFDWNDLGDLATQVYPYRVGLTELLIPRYDYTQGMLTSIPGWASSITYHPNGMVYQIEHANQVTDVWRRDPDQMRRPAAIEAWYRLGTPSATPRFLTGTYGYDGSGNVETLGNGYFVYDRVSRLVDGHLYIGAGGGGALRWQTYSYDAYGNLQNITTNGSTRNTPTSSTTNRLAAGSYDAAGNLTAHNGAFYEYGPFNQMWHYKNGSEESIYIYTADDERLWQYNTDLSHQWTLRALSGKVLREYIFDNPTNQWSVERDYIYRDGSLLASVTPEGNRHFTVDHLGTPRLITDANGNYVSHHTYYPFGEEATWFNQDDERMKFTGHERDLHSTAGTGDDLDYMHARFCSPVTGRFLSVDPISGKPKIPQSWNRYAYALNNPLKYIDPTGRSGQETGKPTADKGQDCSGLSSLSFGCIQTWIKHKLDNLFPPPQVDPNSELAQGLAEEGIDPGLLLVNQAGTVQEGLNESTSLLGAGAAQAVIIVGTDGVARGVGVVDELISGSRQISSSRRLLQLERSGGLDAATNTFDDLARQMGQTARTVEGSNGPVRVIDLPGEGTASFRGFSSGGRPTIQINRPGETPIKIRY